MVDEREELAGVGENAHVGGRAGEDDEERGPILARYAMPLQTQVSPRHCWRQKTLWLHLFPLPVVKEKRRL